LLCSSLAAGAVIEGTVLENRTGKPLARVRVSLESVRGGVEPPAILSDGAGNFRFLELSAGTYRILAERSGFLGNRYGQTRYDTEGSPIVVEGDGRFFATLRLQRPGSIAGAVLDENGVGLSGSSVSAYKIGNRIRMSGTARTDDRGMYRIPALPPGEYYVVSNGRQLEDGTGLLPTYFGQTVTKSQARPVRVAFDEETVGIDISPKPGRMSRISGTVSGGGILAVQLLGDLGMQELSPSLGGRFEFVGLMPGTYELRAFGRPEGEAVSAAATVSLGEEDKYVTLDPASSPAIRIECVGGKPGQGLAVILEREGVSDTESERVDCNGRLQLGAGTWKVRAVPLSGSYVEELSEVSRESSPLGGLFEIRLLPRDERVLRATLGSHSARVLGRLVDAVGGPVAGMPVGLMALSDDVNRKMGGTRLTRTDADGHFRFDGLAPGGYRLLGMLGLDRDNPSSWPAGGKNLTLGDDDSSDIELRWAQ
jgi:5-hydroxyisourate hydrolase-like protein (transthyretin family)